MPVKNAAQWLNECFESIIKQSFTSWELLVIDDGSIDSSRELVAENCLQDDRIKLFRNEGVGIVSALALAFQHSKGNFIHRMDADDVMPVDKLQDLYAAIQNRKKVVLTGQVLYFSDSEVSTGYLDYEHWLNSIKNYRTQVYRECTIASPNWLVHRSCFEEDIELKWLSYPEDYDMVLKWHNLGYAIERLNKLTHKWREHPTRTSRNSDIYQQESFFKLKIDHFIRNELNENESIQVIGAGQKGKLISKLLKSKNRGFEWFDFRQDRVNSIDEIQHVGNLKNDHKSILANWPKDAETQKDIIEFLAGLGLEQGKNLWLF